MLRPWTRGRCTASRLPDLFDRLFHLPGHVLRKRSVSESIRHFLAVSDHPIQEVGEDLSFRRIFGLSRDQQPGKARDRIGVLAWSIGDGNAKIRWHLWSGPRSGGYAFQRCLDEVAGKILHAPVGDVVLY